MVFGPSQIRFLRRPSDAPLFARTEASIKAEVPTFACALTLLIIP